MSKSNTQVRTIEIRKQVVAVTFRRFQHHVTASAPSLPRIKIAVDDHGRFVARAKGHKSKVDASRADKAFDRGVRKFWN